MSKPVLKKIKGKSYLQLNIRLRQDGALTEPINVDELVKQLVNNRIKFVTSNGNTAFLCDIDKNGKILGIIEG